jgi:hypothetical protein
MNTYEIDEYAKKHGFDSLEFTIRHPLYPLVGKKLKGKFQDAYCGIVQLDGQDGFFMLRQFRETAEGRDLIFEPINKDNESQPERIYAIIQEGDTDGA